VSETIVVAANRTGFENGTRYIGSSCVLGLQQDGKAKLYGVLGKGEEEVLVVDIDIDIDIDVDVDVDVGVDLNVDS